MMFVVWWSLVFCVEEGSGRNGPPCPRTSVATVASNQSSALGWLLNSWLLKRTTREKIPNPDIYLRTGSGPFEVSYLTCAHYYIWGGWSSEVEQFIY